MSSLAHRADDFGRTRSTTGVGLEARSHNACVITIQDRWPAAEPH